MKKIIALLLVLVFLASFASAKTISYKENLAINRYYEDSNIAISHKFYADYDNKERHSTYDYRHGYTYRTSKKYWEDNHKTLWEKDYDKRGSYPKKKSYTIERGNYKTFDYLKDEDYYYKSIPDYHYHKKRKCYHSAPKDKLFYIKCP